MSSDAITTRQVDAGARRLWLSGETAAQIVELELRTREGGII
jgi:hypothetical protein